MNKSVEYIVGLRDNFSKKMENMNNTTKKFDSNIGGLMSRFVGLAAIGGVLVNSFNKMRNFEEKMDNLQAITGATGDQLEFLKRKAVELGAATGLGAANVVEAFKLIASAKPELLENADALAEVTKQATILSKASGMTMQQSAESLTATLNQFSMSADQSARIINVLGAGAKFSAAEIPDLTDSLKEFGVAANSMNVSIEQSAAMVETLSEKGIVGRRSGIQLRNILIRLAASGDKNLNPAIVGVNKALENLAVYEKDTTKLTEMFGMESMVAAQALIQNRKRVDELTKAMTDTNVAYEQAAINTDNLNNDMKKLSGTWEAFVLNVAKGDGAISNFLRRTIVGTTVLVDWLRKLNTSAEDLGLERAESLFGSMFKGNETDEERRKVINESIGQYEDALRAWKNKSPDLLDPLNYFKRKKDIETEVAKYTELIQLAQKYYKTIGVSKATTAADDLSKALDEQSAGLTTKITAAAPKIFNITIDKMIENFTVSTTSVTEGSSDIREKVKQTLQEALADVQIIG